MIQVNERPDEQTLHQCCELLKVERAAIENLLNSAAERATMNEEWHQRFAERLARVERALARQEKGNYGRCLECRRWISSDRLRALPYAELCFGCQQAEEGERESCVCREVQND